MSRLGHFLVFFGVVTTIVVGWHHYLWARLVRDTALEGPTRTLATVAVVALGVLMVAMLPLGRVLPREAARPLAFVAFGWMGLAFLLFVGLAFGDLVRVLLGVKSAFASAAVAADPERRAAMARVFGGLAVVFGLVGGAFGVVGARGKPRVVRVRVPIARLPAGLEGTTIAQISDVHVGPTIGREMLSRVVDQLNELGPDLVAITGDLVDGSVASLREHTRDLARLRPRHGAFFVTGNHEYYSGAAAWVEELGRLGVRVLRNEHVTVGEGDARLDVAGVDDFGARGLEVGHGPDLAAALRGRDAARPVVLLAHQPRAAFEAAAAGVDLQLSGHTHGGQIFPWSYLVRLQQPFVAGLHKLHGTWVYVSRGTGYWGPPMRVGAPAEITLIELTRA